ncbi:DNA mismatch repair protein MutS [Arachidicoccus ginsenosidimutans]|uniref:MutS-related protein n=1 Tax=Arachidicoccus sp. BS20 TaxID=1850526 RepID=UPI0007F0815F|nr:DNA mismatch repair protein MutS [Arachidicoccus sp. BS20]ANI89575.1 DNA mismatch repair protein MutS [Arachidicoccus sp. BS20]
MDIDNSTLHDLNIFGRYEQETILHLLNYTRTNGGKEELKRIFYEPFGDVKQIKESQEVIKKFIETLPHFPETITNGTVMVLDKYYDAPVTSIPLGAGALTGFLYKIFSRGDYTTVRYSVKHFIDFVKGMRELLRLFPDNNYAEPLQKTLDGIKQQLDKPVFQKIETFSKDYKPSVKDNLALGFFFNHNKLAIQSLEDLFFRIDAWYSLAKATVEHNFHFPEIVESETPLIEARNLYHPLLENPVGYDFSLTERNNFLFLTGANMAGKSTFIRAVGISVYLASLGMGVPADDMKMSSFDGLLSNIEVADNTLKGESYFFNEVQRIKTTVGKIENGKKWLILIDELFKGTNIQDAMKCSTAVIEGLRKVKSSLFILSTHLYEIGENLKQYPNIQFKYFETEAKDDTLIFSYKLKDGISNDRLGYLILRREKVVDMLDKL